MLYLRFDFLSATYDRYTKVTATRGIGVLKKIELSNLLNRTFMVCLDIKTIASRTFNYYAGKPSIEETRISVEFKLKKLYEDATLQN